MKPTSAWLLGTSFNINIEIKFNYHFIEEDYYYYFRKHIYYYSFVFSNS